MEFRSTDRSPWPKGRWPAPDGGWGWMVVLGSGLVFMVTIGPIGSFGLIFGTFLENIEAGTSDVTFINGLYFALGLLPGVLANRILQLFTCRQVTLFGGAFYFCGCFLSAFSNSVAFLVVTFGIVQGTGFGLLLPAAFTCLNHYFLRRRTLAMGVAQLMAAVGVMLYPLLIEVLLENYGFRGTQAILAALSLHTIVGAITMKPLDFSEVLMTRKTWEKSIEETLRRQSIISIKSFRLKTDDDNEITLKTILESSEFEEIPLRDGRAYLNTNCVTKVDAVMEEDEDTICETKFLLDKCDQRSVQNSVQRSYKLNVPGDKALVSVEPTGTESNLTKIQAKSDMDIIMSGAENKNVSNLQMNYKEIILKYSSISSDIFDDKTSVTKNSKESTHSRNLRKKRRKSLEFLKKECQLQPKGLSIQSNVLKVKNSKINSSLPNMLVNNIELNPRSNDPCNGTGNVNENIGRCSDYSNKMINNPKQTCPNPVVDNVSLAKSRKETQRTILNNGVTLEVPKIDIIAATDSEREGSSECIKRAQSERSLTRNNNHDYHKKHLEMNSTSSLDDPPESNHTSNTQAFTKDYPHYRKTFNRSRSRERGVYTHDSLEYFDTKLTKSSSASNLPCVYNEKHIDLDQTKRNQGFHEASRKIHSNHESQEVNPHEIQDPHRVHPCFYDDLTSTDPTTSYEPQNATASSAKQNPKAHRSTSSELIPRFPSSARAEPSNNRLPVVRISKPKSSQENIEDDCSESLSFGISEDTEPPPPINRARRQSVISWTADCLDLALMKDVIYVNIIIGVSFVLFSDNMFFNLQPLYYLSLGLQGSEVAVCIAINSAADFLGRVCFVVSSSWLTYKNRLIFLLASVGTVLFRVGFLVVYDFQMICLMTAFLGFFRSWINVCIPLIFAEYSTVDRFPAAYGLHLLTAGFVHLLIGPFVGLIRDVSDSYPACLGAVTGCLLFCVVPWIAEALLFRRSTVLSISG